MARIFDEEGSPLAVSGGLLARLLLSLLPAGGEKQNHETIEETP
mgnify:CR=1 FL=1